VGEGVLRGLGVVFGDGELLGHRAIDPISLCVHAV